ncbi:T9SS sorting signal type C domain-containing protein [Flavobacterium sp. GN10]|uniref:T9SS sorting signal type C domain-containing protein n=1 Tax=Flavobacterium tagetis TaxID=2801336 RepID=A0ABS1KA82_9FLAO|nr:T9SS sorting signal type C domain-containing protein [Flavobacterium tagetis]MBL0736420.1 T9SS sorting signal type C domain-containing protein [Flavobacterium tagetis]
MMRKLLYSFLFFISSKILSKRLSTPSLGLLCVGMFFVVSFVKAETFYSKATGDPNVLSRWGKNLDGTGTAPTTFGSTADTFVIRNGSTMTTTGSDWTVAGTVTINNDGALVVNSNMNINLGNFNIDGGGIATINRSLTVTGVTNITGTINFGSTNSTSRIMTFTGALTLNNGAVWNETTNGAAATFSFGNNFTNNATTFVAQNPTHTFTGTNRSLNGNTTTLIPNVSVTGIYTNNISTLTVSSALSGGGTLTNATGMLLNIGGTSTITNLVASTAVNTVNYNGSGNQTIKVTTYSNLVISGGGSKTATGNLTINNDFTLSGGTFVANNATSYTHSILGNYIQTGGIFDFNAGTSGVSKVNIAGNFTNTAGAGSITTVGVVQNGIFTFNGTGIQTLTMPADAAAIFTKYNVNSGSTLKLASDLTLSTALTSDTDPWMGELNTSGVIDLGNYKVTASGGRGSSGTAKFILNSGATLITANATGVDGSVPNTATMLRTFDSGANYTFNGTVAQTTSAGLPGTVNNLTISNTNSAGVTLSKATTVSKNFSILAGSIVNLSTFTHSTATLTLGGAVMIPGSWGSTGSAALNKNDIYFVAAASGIVNNTCTSPVITNQPQALMVCEGGSGTFSVASSTSGVSYQWQYSLNGTSWTNIDASLGTYVSGYSTNTLSLSNTPVGWNSYRVRCIVYNGLCAVNSNSALLTVNQAPTANAGIDQYGTGAFTMTANTPTFGTGTWSIVSGPNMNTNQFGGGLSNPTATFTPSGAGIYTLRWTITNSCGTSTDDVVLSNCVGNLIKNGDFSTGTSQYWSKATTKGSYVEVYGESVYFGNGNSEFTAELDSQASLGQSVTVIPNVPYTLSFLYARRPGSSPTTALDFKIVDGSNTISQHYTSSDNTSTPVFVNFPFTPTTSSIWIEFYNSLETTTLGSIIDNIVLLPSSQVNPVATTSPKGKYKTLDACDGASVQLDVDNISDPNVTYTWSTTSTGVTFSRTDIKNPKITVTGTGTKNATVVVTTTPGGCSSTASTTYVNVLALPVAGLTSSDADNIFCAGTSVTFTASGGTSYAFKVGSTVVQSGNSATYTTTALTNGQIVTVDVTNASGCTKTSTGITNTVNAIPTAGLSSSDSDNTFCAGTSVTFTASGGTSYVFKVGSTVVQSGNSATYTTASLTNGQVVSVDVTNASGCTSTSAGITNTVNALPTAGLSSSDSDNTFCAGTSVTFTASGGTSYAFKVGSTVVQSGNSTTYTTTALTNGQVVSVDVTNASGCTSTSAGITNTVNALPIAGLTSSDSDNTFCAGTSVIFTASGGTSYVFKVGSTVMQSGNSTTYTTTALTNGQVVSVDVTNVSGCTSTSVGITNTVHALPTVPTITKNNDAACNTLGSITLTDLPADWTISQTGQMGSHSYDGTDFSLHIEGLEVGDYSFTVTNKATGCTSSAANVTIINTSSNTDWGPSGWTNGEPDGSKSVTISSLANGQPFSLAKPNIDACSLTITVGSDVIVPSGVTLTITNKVTSNGKLVFESGSSLIQTTNVQNSGDIVYKRVTSIRRFDLTYWSSPITSTKQDGFMMKDLSPETLFDKYSYWSSSFKWATDLYGNMEMKPGIGYSIRGPQSFSIETPGEFIGKFSGIPNNGDVPISTTADKYLLIGNPYPSAIDGRKFITDNGDVGALYFWTHMSLPKKAEGSNTYKYSSPDYAVFTLLGATRATTGGETPTGYIGVGQGFFIKPKVTSVKFNNGQRVQAQNSQFFKTTAKEAAIEVNRLWLTLSNTDDAYKQILIGYAEGATNSFDYNYDAVTLAGNTYVDFYTINEAQKLSIQARSLPFDNTERIPLGYKSVAETQLTISIDHADGFFNQQAVYLEDKTTGTITDLRASNYTFKTGIGTFTDRFVLRYTNKTLGTDDIENLENSVLISVKNKIVNITCSKETIKEVNIFNVGAQLLYTKNKVNSSEIEINSLHSSDQVLLVKVTLENGSTITKKVIFSNLE